MHHILALFLAAHLAHIVDISHLSNLAIHNRKIECLPALIKLTWSTYKHTSKTVSIREYDQVQQVRIRH